MKNQEVPFLDLKALHSRYVDTMVGHAKDVISNAAFIGGAPVTKFENEFAAYCDAQHCIGVANGTDAILLGLDALGIGSGHEVITSANTFFATVEAIEHTGAKTVLVDCDQETWLIDPAAVEAAITPRTAAIAAVHLYGQPAPMAELRDIADRHGLALLEDCAQAHGARLNGQRIGTISDVAAFSFYPGKNLGACGDGGAVITNNEDLAQRIRVLSQHGQAEKYQHELMGYNSRLDTLQALFLSEKLKDLDADNARRRAAAARYTESLNELGDFVITPYDRAEVESVYHLYVVHVADRETLLRKLGQQGVNCAIHYPIPCHLQAACRHLGYRKGDFPNAEFNGKHCLSLPMFPTITDQQIDRVCQALADEIGKQKIPERSAA